MAVVRSGGRAAITDYEVVKSFRYVSLLRCILRTGRTHQIRVHLKHLGHPSSAIRSTPVRSGEAFRTSACRNVVVFQASGAATRRV